MSEDAYTSKHDEELLLSAEYEVFGGDFSSAGEVSTDIKARLKRIGFDASLVRRVAIASFEAEMNVILYAITGDVLLEVTPSRIMVEFTDQGPGIPDVDLAMQEGYTTAPPGMRKLGYGAGMGFPTMKRNAGHIRLESKPGSGTRVKLFFTP